MKTNLIAGLLSIALLVGMNLPGAFAADVAKAPTTIWHFLGIPQTTKHLRDATANHFGKHPGLERKDPVLRIADPANLKSDNPAIKAAAQIKTEADLQPQKIKAIRYLAKIGCACSPRSGEIQKALLAALDDCSEEVRYEAAKALCQTTGSICQSCDATCCGSDAITKLRDVAVGKDDQGCWNESSSRVRAVALFALNRCEMKYVPEKAKKPEKTKPPEVREQRDQPEGKTRDLEPPLPSDLDTEEPISVPEPATLLPIPKQSLRRMRPAGQAWISGND